MKVRAEQLTGQLNKGMAPIYFISGDEPLQVSEAVDAVRAHARGLGFSERQVFSHDKDFDWNQLQSAADTLSLFAEQRIMELRLPSGKPGTEGGKALTAYAERPAEDTVLIISSGKLDAGQTRSAWYKALDKAGVTVQVWPVEAAQLPSWIGRRAQARGLSLSPEAAQLLADRVEGNLLAAAQEVEKLCLLHGEARLEAEDIIASVADSARYNVYKLVDTALEGQPARARRMLVGLRSEGIEPPIVLWALTREIRSLAGLAAAQTCGASADQAMAQYRVWESRKPVVRKGLQRHPLAVWQALLAQCAEVDRMIKGMAQGDPWEALTRITLVMAGVWQPDGLTPTPAALSALQRQGY